MQKLQLSGIYGEFSPAEYAIGCDMASGPDSTIVNGMIIENNADFDVKKMREMLNKFQSRETGIKSFVEHIAGQPLTPWQERMLIGAHGRMTGKESILKSLTGIDIAGYRKALWYVTDEFRDKVIFAQAGSQIASAFPEPSAWREFIETKGPVDDGVSWLFRKSLVSMAITQVIKS